ncbi:hypothetical protein ACT17Q_15870 [Cellulomonas sp. CW35]|uniref:hypothetical protein n=1 Tax=Cellulomonas sp. CW35 TaxID=3458249 RepID=UPI004033B44D
MRLYARSRRLVAAVVTMTVLAVGNGLVGGRLLTLMSSDQPLMMPYRYVLSMFIAIIGVASLESPVAQTDRSDTGPLWRTRQVHLLAMLAITVALGAVSELATANGTPAQAVRAGLFWYGLALISAGVGRAAYAWVLPMVALFPLVWWGNAGGGPASWNWATAPAVAALSWFVAITCLLLGAGASLLRR